MKRTTRNATATVRKQIGELENQKASCVFVFSEGDNVRLNIKSSFSTSFLDASKSEALSEFRQFGNLLPKTRTVYFKNEGRALRH